ncbi:MAG: 2-iminoacetate synthase ThiH [Planctomycetota bacterium]
MSEFRDELAHLPLAALARLAREASRDRAAAALAREDRDLDDFAALLAPAAGEHLERQARAAHELTLRRFGRVMPFFAPIYLSNECVNTCLYCGHSRELSIRRRTLEIPEIRAEAGILRREGFRHILLVAGEHPHVASVKFLEDAVRAIHPDFPTVAVEVAPLAETDYRRLASAGVTGLVLYQETYNRGVYDRVHAMGPKRDFEWRLETPERGGRAGMRRLGIGFLQGLNPDWREDAIALAAHARFLMKHHWRSFVTVSVPRLRPATGAERFVPASTMSDREYVQLLTALRLALPDAGIVLSTRETAILRDGLAPLGVTLMSAGSRTEPGGYGAPDGAAEQFDVEDRRPLAEVAATITRIGYEPVFKDWEGILHGA